MKMVECITNVDTDTLEHLSTEKEESFENEGTGDTSYNCPFVVDQNKAFSGGCVYCNIAELPQGEFIIHHLKHIQLPSVQIQRICIPPESLPRSYIPEKVPVTERKEHFILKRSYSATYKPLTFKFIKTSKTENSYLVHENNKDILNINQDIRNEKEMSEVAPATVVSEAIRPPAAVSPTPSEILRPEGFMPQSPCGGSTKGEDEEEDEDKDDVARKSESPTSEMEHDAEDDNDSGIVDRKPNTLSDDNEKEISESKKCKTENIKTDDSVQQDADSGAESERDGYTGFENTESTPAPTPPPPPTPAPPKVGSLTILAPSVLNGTLSITPSGDSKESSNVSEPISVLGGLSIEPVSLSSSSVTVTPATGNSERNGDILQGMEGGDATDPLMLHGFMDQTSGDNMEYMPLDRLGAGTGSTTCEVCGEHASDPVAMEAHKTNHGHFKCHVSPDCTVLIFSTKSELASHELNAHGIQPHSTSPAPMEQLAQQVQRLPVPYQTSPSQSQHGSPRSSPGLQPAQIYKVPLSQSISPQPNQPAQGTIQPRAFANINQARMPMGQGGVAQDRSNSPNQRMPLGKRPVPFGAGAPGPANGKQRRFDMLIPDKHDDADCHVIAMQKHNDSGLQIQNVQGGSRETNGFQLSNAISLTTTTGGRPIVSQPQKKGSDANAVANILATRGITVTPAGGNRQPQQLPQQQQQQQAAAGRNAIPAPVTTLNLNSAISIIPTNQGRQNIPSGFAVPQGRIRNQPPPIADRPNRCPTVDLTQDTPTVHRGRPPGRSVRHTCQVCDKVFTTSDALATHMVTHRSPGKLPYRCNLCNAQYPTQQGLTQHKQTFHKEHAGSEMALPVVDLKQPGLTNRLASLGIRHIIPLSQLQSQTGGMFGLPIIAIDNARNPAVCNLGALGASNVLSLGPTKAIGPPR